jgi:hypothetical protein
MLSNQELQNIRQALANNPSKNAERKLKNKLIEHDYASKYPPFSPLVHHRQFVNKKTDEQTLYQLIDAAKISEIILLDTESVTAHRQPNRPGLIQLQLIPNDAVPIVALIEVHHLPPTNSNEFKLMQEFFRIVLDSDKVIYTWGTIDELTPFTTFKLFNIKQIYLPENENLQDLVKKYWQLCHKHKATVDCNCEDCLGKKPDQPWKLSDAVAHLLHEWLDKRHTCSPFNIGLDPQLRQLSTEQLEYRTILTNYAANDVLSMEKVMIGMQEQPPPTSPIITSTNHPENVPENQDEILPNTIDTTPVVLLLHPSSPLSITQHQLISDQQTNQQQHHHHQTKKETEHQHEKVNCQHQREEKQNYRTGKQHQTDSQDKQEGTDQHRSNERNRTDYRYQRQEHNADIERTQKNRTSTIRQRQRHFRHEIIRRGIDPRFSITIVKEILRRYEVPYTAVQISKSKMTRRSSLYIGIRYPSKIRKYEIRTRYLFTTDYYNEFCARNRYRR